MHFALTGGGAAGLPPSPGAGLELGVLPLPLLTSVLLTSAFRVLLARVELAERLALASCGCAWLRLSLRPPCACASSRPSSPQCGACGWLRLSSLLPCASSFGRPFGPPIYVSGSFLTSVVKTCGFGSELEPKFRRLARGTCLLANCSLPWASEPVKKAGRTVSVRRRERRKACCGQHL